MRLHEWPTYPPWGQNKHHACSSTSLHTAALNVQGANNHNKKLDSNGLRAFTRFFMSFLCGTFAHHTLCHDAFLPARYGVIPEKQRVAEVKIINKWHVLITNNTGETIPLEEKHEWSQMELGAAQIKQISLITSPASSSTFCLGPQSFTVKMQASFPWF